jgi:hypothetical protein
MNFLIQRIYGEISMSIIDVLIEEQGEAAAGNNEDYQMVLKRIYNSNDLDERRMICAEFLGYTEQANTLREWFAEKGKRNAAKLPSENLRAGDVIRIKGKPGIFIVMEFYNREDTDHVRGDSYCVDEFQAARMSARAFADNISHCTHFEEEVTKTHYFYFLDGSMHGHGEGISRSDVKVIGTFKMKTEVTTTLLLSNYKEVK